MKVKEILDNIDIDRVVPYFQPIMDLEHHSVWSYECLARLVTEKEQTFLPSDFLFLVEREHSFGELTRRVFHASSEYFRDNNLAWSINISQQDIIEPTLTKFLNEFVKHYPNPNRITLEIMASTALNHRAEFQSFLQVCKALDIRLLVDHFGGVSGNILTILDMPVDGIKIDGSLVKQMAKSQEAADFVDHLNQLASERNIAVIAEHIEDKSCLDAVRSLGIRYGQGFYFSKPQAYLN
ncbi:EAL domain-containing protein [Aliiglaciecola sp. CAU 1673]|uniref:EAL domain-containing protein n=1 Tax=Aliiglaciecola sp. CAU 1673 TaxID=3032595 RepID=UPI0023DB09A6|nr:EAL domain-containing protein [Aliiglaciecola sp. CAU 1673]MDF2177802.1 EAL domain-containing protein [Aliiglaciecola sp. CAU 1673]